MIFIFWMLSFKPAFSFSLSFTNRLFSSSLLSQNIFRAEWRLDIPPTFLVFVTGPSVSWWKLALESLYIGARISQAWILSSQKKVLEQSISNGLRLVFFDIDFLFLVPLWGYITERFNEYYFWSPFICFMTQWLAFCYLLFFLLSDYYVLHT